MGVVAMTVPIASLSPCLATSYDMDTCANTVLIALSSYTTGFTNSPTAYKHTLIGSGAHIIQMVCDYSMKGVDTQ